MSGAAGRPVEVLRAEGSLRVSGDSPIQSRGFYLSGFVSSVLAILKFRGMVQWSWWRVFLPLWVMLGHTASYLLVGFLCLFAVRYGKDGEEQPAKVRNARISCQLASLMFVLISTDNLLRWQEQSYWFWLCSGRMAMVVLSGALALGAQFLNWAEIVRGLNDQLDEG